MPVLLEEIQIFLLQILSLGGTILRQATGHNIITCNFIASPRGIFTASCLDPPWPSWPFQEQPLKEGFKKDVSKSGLLPNRRKGGGGQRG